MQLTNLSRSQKKHEMDDWLVFIRIMFEPLYFQTSHRSMQSFDLQKFTYEALEEGAFTFGWVIVRDDNNECSFHFDGQQLIIKNILKKKTFFRYEAIVRDYIENKLEKMAYLPI